MSERIASAAAVMRLLRDGDVVRDLRVDHERFQLHGTAAVSSAHRGAVPR